MLLKKPAFGREEGCEFAKAKSDWDLRYDLFLLPI